MIARDVAGEARLDADDPLPVAFDGAARGRDVYAREIHEFAHGLYAARRDVDEDARAVGRGLDNLHEIVDIFVARGTGIDERGDAVLQACGGRHARGAEMRMDIDQAGHDKLAGGVESFTGIPGSDSRADGRDLAVVNRHVHREIEAPRGIDHMATANHQIVLGGTEFGGSGEHGGNESARAKKLAAGWQA